MVAITYVLAGHSMQERLCPRSASNIFRKFRKMFSNY